MGFSNLLLINGYQNSSGDQHKHNDMPHHIHQRLLKDQKDKKSLVIRWPQLILSLTSELLGTTTLKTLRNIFGFSKLVPNDTQVSACHCLIKVPTDFCVFSPQPRKTFGQVFCGSLDNFGILCLGLYRMIDEEARNPENKRGVCLHGKLPPRPAPCKSHGCLVLCERGV